MKSHVIVIPSDQIIIVDGTALHFSFPAPENFYALQWHNGQGEMEFTDSQNKLLAQADYATHVIPFVKMIQTAKRK